MIDFEKIGKYKVTGKLGQGSFGVVYRGRDDYLKRDVAIKVCSVEDENLRKRFQREGQISAKLTHRSIGTVYEAGSERGIPYLVQEMLSGEDLSRLVKRREGISPALKLDYLLQVAGGLDYAHAEGVIHRDIKPGNIRVLGDGRIKIMDFGIAKLASAETQLTRKGVTMGTASYLPPEQIRGVELDHRADIFSFGVLAYELLTFERPFKGNTLSALIYQILYKIPQTMRDVWSDCPAPLSDLIAKCLEKKPERRFASFAELIPRLTDIRQDVLAGRWPALKEVTRVPLTDRPGNESSDVLSQSAIAQTARSVLEGKVGDYTISTSASAEILRPSSGEGRSTRPVKATAAQAVAEAAPAETSPAELPTEKTQVIEPRAEEPPTEKPPAENPQAFEPQPAATQPDSADLKTRIVTLPPLPPAPEMPAESAHATQRFAAEPSAAEPVAEDPEDLTIKAREIIDLVAEGKLAAEAAKEQLEATIRPREATAELPIAPTMPPAPVAPTPVAPTVPQPKPTLETTTEAPEPGGFVDQPAETPPGAARSDTYRTFYRPPLGALKWAGLAATVVVVVGLGWLILGGDSAEIAPLDEPPPPPESLVQPQVTPPALGAVTVDAVPWAQVTEITDAQGYVQQLPSQHHTPLYLELAPGRYTIQLQGPDSEEVQTCEVDVTLETVASCAPAFPEPDVTEYFKETGWWD